MQKRISALLDSCNIIKSFGKDVFNENVIAEGIAYDSRNVKKNYVFFALTGVHTDGHKFIDAAIKNGASAIFVSVMPELEKIDSSVSYFLVDDTRKAMAFFSAAFFDNPEKKLKIIGVTGTDGKSSTVSFIYQLLNFLGKKTGFISTVEYDCTGKIEKNPYRQSTPESSEIMQILWNMVQNNFEYAVIESTSHGLSEKTQRLASIRYNAGVLTNITHEHLEFHGTIENYANDKANLFRKAEDFCVINHNESFKNLFIDAAKVPVFSYSILSAEKESYAPDIFAFDIEQKSNFADSSENCGFNFKINYNKKDYSSFLPFMGAFNIENFLAAVITVSKITGIEAGNVISFAEKLKAVKGRMEIVNKGQNFNVIVDYAHTPGAFKKVLPMIKKFLKGRLMCVFGSAGERDIKKRAQQGEIASNYCDIIVLTDEDPRGENSLAIIDDIALGIKKDFDKNFLYKIPNRQEAIDKAVSLAKQGDCILLLGKGHESSIIYKNGAINWDEKEAAEKALTEARRFISK